ncbi:hypothetical protein JD969_06405 [Planctomycetota bacterium]|nr:hypothetical protein JD969_06405 [Planctomycetota bacterium]
MNRLSKKHLLTFSIIASILIACVVSYNMLLDPYNAYPSVHLSMFNKARAAGAYQRGRAESIQANQWSTLLMGSSIMEVGFDAANSNISDRNAHNIALNGTTLPEITAAFEYMLENKHPIKRIMLTFDNHWLWYAKPITNSYKESPLNPDYSLVDYHASNLLGFGTIENTNKILINYFNDTPPAYTSFGQRVKPILKPSTSQHKVFAKHSALASDDKQHADWSQQINLKRLEEFITTSQNNNIKLTIALPPMHAISIQRMDDYSLKHWEQGKRKLVQLVERLNQQSLDSPTIDLWDFATINTYSTESIPSPKDTSRMKYFWDKIHITSTTGDIILNLIFNQATPSTNTPYIGSQITSSNIDSHLNTIRDARSELPPLLDK